MPLIGSGLIQSADTWPKASDWLIRDEFTDTVAAGSVNSTAAMPGPGTRAVTDTESKLSVGGGALAFAGGKASPGFGDPGLWYGLQTRVVGLAALTRFRYTTTGGGGFMVGYDSNQAGTLQDSLRFSSNDIKPYIAGSYGPVIGSVAASTDFIAASVCLSTGYLHLLQSDNDWILLYVVRAGTGNVYPGISNYDNNPTVDYFRCIALPAPFDTDDGLATDTHSGAVSAGTTFTHEADCLIEFTLTTLPSAGSVIVKFRIQDSSNYWQLILFSGGSFTLQEIVSNSATSRANIASGLASGQRIFIVCDGTTIWGYYNNTLAWTYNSAVNFATATAGKLESIGAVGGSVSDLKTWPRTLSGTAASILNKVSA